VEIPGDRLVGEVGQGWRAAITTLMHERSAVAGMSSENLRTAAKGSPLDPIMSHVRLAQKNALTQDGQARNDLAELYINARLVELLGRRVQEHQAAVPEAGPDGSILKLAKALLYIQAANLTVDLGGSAGMAWDDNTDLETSKSVYGILSSSEMSLGGGTNNIQRNIIGERLLGLPKEPEVDKNLPFRELKVGTQR
jgi:alkylation response protein AidB-like acyl-CoA dehydrogenase